MTSLKCVSDNNSQTLTGIYDMRAGKLGMPSGNTLPVGQGGQLYIVTPSGKIGIHDGTTWKTLTVTPAPSGYAPDTTIISGGLLWWGEPSGYVLVGSHTSGISDWTKRAGIITTSVVAPTTSDYPFIVSGVKNGHRCAFFGGASFFQAGGGFNLDGADKASTIFIVSKANDIGQDSAMFALNRAASANAFHSLGFRSTPPINAVRVFRRDDVPATVDYREPNQADTNWNIWCVSFSGTNVGVYKNGLQISSSGMNVGQCTFTLTTIGAYAGGGTEGSWWKGYIAEVIVYNSGSSDSAMSNINSYLSSKYKIPLAVGYASLA